MSQKTKNKHKITEKSCENNFTGEISVLANDLMFDIWWWEGIGTVVVFDDKFTPDGNGTETTKLTDVAGWCGWCGWSKCSKKQWTFQF